MSTNYLRSFIESVSDVPAELERWFRGMRELDERAHGLQVQLEADCQQQLRLAAEQQQHGNKRAKATGDMDSGPTLPTQPGNEPVDLDQRIEDTTAELLKLSAEKTNAAQQIYDYVDQHIRKLDKDLKTFDAEIAVERSKLGLPPIEVAGTDAEAKRSRKDGGTPHVMTSEELYQAALAAADASEPTYCYCKRISFGEMIACEHPECLIEWFHFECVGLTAENRPKGKWYCKECRKLMGKK
ncbi:hypothetical protein ACKKBG_A01425 [Auxenochlorella protothecoides x Auxenochlorella symbiontica]